MEETEGRIRPFLHVVKQQGGLAAQTKAFHHPATDGTAIELKNAPTIMMAVTQGNANYLVMANSWTEKDAMGLLMQALTATKLDSPVFHPAW